MNRVFGALLAAGLGMAVTGVAAAESYKLGFVDVPKIVQSAPQAEAANKRLEKEFAPRDRDLVAAQKDIQKMQEKLDRDSAVMSDSQRRDLENDIRGKQRDLARKQQEFREDFAVRRNEELQKFQKDVREAIVSLGKDKGYDFIFSDGVVFASDKVDLTDELLRRLKSR